jgi:hypothetical protein
MIFRPMIKESSDRDISGLPQLCAEHMEPERIILAIGCDKFPGDGSSKLIFRIKGYALAGAEE